MTMTITRILVPTDFGPGSVAAVDYAIELARRFPASIQLLHVVEPPRRGARPAPRLTLEAVRRKRAAAERRLRRTIPRVAGVPFGLDHEVRLGDPATMIVECAREEFADLIVMATTPASADGGTPCGHTSERVARTALCPVLTLPCHVDRVAAGA
jgi:universal stress protein A